MTCLGFCDVAALSKYISGFQFTFLLSIGKSFVTFIQTPEKYITSLLLRTSGGAFRSLSLSQASQEILLLSGAPRLPCSVLCSSDRKAVPRQAARLLRRVLQPRHWHLSEGPVCYLQWPCRL